MFETIIAFIVLFAALIFILKRVSLRFKKLKTNSCACSENSCESSKN